ncbi:MAG: L,D-transpeptidase [Pararhodobacter sp.]|nr:L,D-transpeptidase [Pararhodobacter sp.]
MTHRTPLIGFALIVLVSACAAPTPPTQPDDPVAQTAEPLPPEVLAMYAGRQDGAFWIEPVDPRYLSMDTIRQEVDYWTDARPGSIIVDPWDRRLYLGIGTNRAMRYTVGVGDQGRQFSGDAHIPYSREWPRWTPTENMLRRDPETNAPYRDGMAGGVDNPLGARALYLHRGGRDTLYRIHGTPYPWTVGEASSSGCIRMFQQDVIDLHERVGTARASVTVLREEQAGRGTVPPGTQRPDINPATIPMAEAQTLQRMADENDLTLDMLLGSD